MLEGKFLSFFKYPSKFYTNVISRMNTLYQRIKQIIKKHESLYYVIYHIKVYGLYLINRFSHYQVEKEEIHGGQVLNYKFFTQTEVKH
jgi:hypothetical protein